MAAGSYTIEAVTFNGQYYDTPQTLTFPCTEYLEPIGIMDVVEPTFNGAILKRKVYVLRHDLDMIGTAQFSTHEEYNNFIASNCYCCEDTPEPPTPPTPTPTTCPTGLQANVVGFTKTVDIGWNAVDNAVGYVVIIYSNSSATTVVDTIFTTDRSIEYNGNATLDYGQTYWVRVLSYTGTSEQPVYADTDCSLIHFVLPTP